MSAEKPWEDESLKGAYYKEKARLAKPPVAAPKPKAPGLTDLADPMKQADKLAKRNKKVADKVGGWSRK
jgi:hypothetical protein